MPQVPLRPDGGGAEEGLKKGNEGRRGNKEGEGVWRCFWGLRRLCLVEEWKGSGGWERGEIEEGLKKGNKGRRGTEGGEGGFRGAEASLFWGEKGKVKVMVVDDEEDTKKALKKGNEEEGENKREEVRVWKRFRRSEASLFKGRRATWR